MSETATATSAPIPGKFHSLTTGKMTVTSNTESAESMKENFESLEAPKDGPEPDPEKEAEDKIKRAASELGRKGAEARAAAAKEASEKAREEKRKADPRHNTQARIDEKTRLQKEAERDRDKAAAEAKTAREEAAAVKAKVAELEARISQRAAPSQAQPGAGVVPPSSAPGRASDDDAPLDAEKFKLPNGEIDGMKYLQALEQRASDKAEKRILSKLEEKEKVQRYANTIRAQMQATADHFESHKKVDPEWAKKVHPDLFKVLTETTSSIPPGQEGTWHPRHVIADEVHYAGEKAPALLIHLTEHPEELQRIIALRNPSAMQVEMRVLARSLPDAAHPSASAPKTQVSKAKPPVKALTGSPNTAENELTDSTSDEEYFRKMQAKRRAQR